MKIQIPRVVVAVPLAGYAKELEGQFLQVWVNPPMAMLERYNHLVAEVQTHELERVRATVFPEKQAEAPASPLQKTWEQLSRWVNSKRNGRDATNSEILAWYAEIWSQGPAETHWTVDELQSLEREDPAFLSWMITETWRARNEHTENKKKS